MPISIPSSTLDKFSTFGDLLRFLRRRVSLTQMELAHAVGYSHTQISRLEQNLRLPDIRKLLRGCWNSPPMYGVKTRPLRGYVHIKD